MHILNDGKHAFVFPPRCGTRWIAAELYNRGLLSTKGPNHDFNLHTTDVKIFMFVRNPFERERSLHRWLSETNQIDINEFTFEEYVNSKWFDMEPSWYTRYGDLNNHVQHIDIADLTNFFKDTLNIELPEYDNFYHLADDHRNDDEIFKNTQIVEKILLKYQEDIKHIHFNLTKYI
jgi:hypothetical protein|tara:strand:+ start:389 stop:916 length:528 start_codon:yes stop_codon:yes gene_type:complete